MHLSPIARLAESTLRAYARVAPTERGGYRLARLVRRFRSTDARRDVFRTPLGLTLDLDLNCYPDCTMAFGLYELDTVRVIRRLLRHGDHFVDGGANIGYMTMIGAQCVGPNGRVDAFEPQPDNRARLEVNLHRNGMGERVRVHAQALSDAAGTAAIHRFANDRGNHGMASLFADGGAVSSVDVPTVRLDDALARTSPVLIKLDVEGAESLAISGMTGLLKAPRPPAVILEHNRDTLRRAGGKAGLSEPVRLLLATREDWQVRVIAFGLPRIDSGDTRAWQRLRQVNLLVQSPAGAAPMLR